MKYLTKYFWLFCLTAFILSTLFYSCLSWCLVSKNYLLIIIAAIAYAASMFYCGKYFGIKNSKAAGVNDWGFYFHLATFLIWGLVSFIWTVIPNSGLDTNYPLGAILLAWGFGLSLHGYYFLKYKDYNSIEGFEKEEIFE